MELIGREFTSPSLQRSLTHLQAVLVKEPN
jgi:hypothetical protein